VGSKLSPKSTCTVSCVQSSLLQVSLEAKATESFKTPKGVCVPFGSMDLALAERPAAEQQRFASLLAASETAGIAELDGIADEMQVGLRLDSRAVGLALVSASRGWHA
jgi:hypothetical protein